MSDSRPPLPTDLDDDMPAPGAGPVDASRLTLSIAKVASVVSLTLGLYIYLSVNFQGVKDQQLEQFRLVMAGQAALSVRMDSIEEKAVDRFTGSNAKIFELLMRQGNAGTVYVPDVWDIMNREPSTKSPK